MQYQPNYPYKEQLIDFNGQNWDADKKNQLCLRQGVSAIMALKH